MSDESAAHAGRGSLVVGCLLLFFVATAVVAVAARYRAKVNLYGPSIETRLRQSAAEPVAPLPAEVEAVLRDELEAEIRVLQELEARWQDTAAAAAQNPPDSVDQQWSERQRRLAQLLASPEASFTGLREGYLEVRRRWNQMVHQVLAELESSPRSPQREPLPPFDLAGYRRLRESPVGGRYRELYVRLESDLFKFRDRELAGREAQLERRLLKTGEVNQMRAAFLDRLMGAGYFPALDLESHYLDDLLLELKIIPIRLLVIYQMREWRYLRYLGQGFAGYRQLFSEFVFLVMALGLPFLALAAQRWWQQQRVTSGGSPVRSRAIAWSALAVLLGLESWMLSDTLLHDLGSLFLLAAIYAAYRAWLEFTLGATVAVVRSLPGDEPENTAARWQASARSLGRFLLLSFMLLALAQALTARGLLFHSLTRLVFLLLLVFYLALAWRWRREQAGAWPALLGSSLGGRLSKAVEQPLGALLLCPLLLPVQLALASVRSLARWSSRYEISKPFMAGFLRHWIQTTARFEGRREPVAQRYLDAFSAARPDDSELFSDDDLSLVELLGRVRSFGAGAALEPLVLVGEPGAGKSTLLNRIEHQAAGAGVTVKRWQVSARLFDPADCDREMRATFSLEAEQDFSQLAESDRVLILVDDLHHLFLAQVGGFGAINSVLETFRSLVGRVLLIATCQKIPFEYLTRALGPQVGMPQPLYLPRLTDHHLRRLILSRHQQTGFAFRFDRGIYGAAEGESSAGLDHQFFQILWEQSQGNPQAAATLWLKSLSADPDEPSAVLVRVPPLLSSRLFVEAADDELFALASLMRHGALTRSELSTAAGLARRRVDAILPRWQKAEVLRHLDGRWQVDIEFYFYLERYLKGRNFLNAR